MNFKRAVLFSSFIFLSCQYISAQSNLSADTVSLNLDDAEKLFLQKSFLLLAERCNVNAADAAIIQAKLYPNPNLSIDQGAYNKTTKKWFDISKTGQTSVSLQQVIILAGKRNKQISIAKINSQISVYRFYDLIRTLRYELRTSFYGLYFLRQSIIVYNREIESLKSLIDVYADQYKKGNIAFKELARLQALQFSLENERIDLIKDADEKQSNLVLLTGDTLSRPVQPVVEASSMDRIDAHNLNYIQLVDSGLTNRYDLLASIAQVQLNEANFSLQKSLRTPDLTLGANWDRQGSYIPNYNSLSVAIDLPFWNRNQGNIKVAQYGVEGSRQQQSQAELQIRSDIGKAFGQLLETDKLYKAASSQFNSDYEKLLDGITKGYRNHTISMLEFIDYYETYKNSKIEFNKLQNSRLEALENLNLATGSTILK